jgi:hypothetical protein
MSVRQKEKTFKLLYFAKITSAHYYKFILNPVPVPELDHIGHGDAFAHPLRLRLLAAPLHSSSSQPARPHHSPPSAAAHQHTPITTAASVPIIVLIVVATIIAAIIPVCAAILFQLAAEGELVVVGRAIIPSVPVVTWLPATAAAAPAHFALVTDPGKEQKSKCVNRNGKSNSKNYVNTTF